MKFYFYLATLVLLLIGCNSIENAGSSTPSTPDEQQNENIIENSPRADAVPTATILPPTWTPIPMEPPVHLPAGSGSPSVIETRFEYVIQRGDTLAQICNKYGVSISEVARINNISNWDRIEVGQVLTLPISGN